MLKKLVTISLTLVAALSFAAAPAFANDNSNNSHNYKPSKDEIVYDLPDNDDNQHPSGKDRSVENGRSLTQGKSQSDPDDNGKGPERSNGKSDKPGSVGGVDKEDQDGNNGCGNDDDFEDDNEGWCGKKPKEDKPECPKGPKEPETPKEPEEPKTPKEPETPEVPTTPRTPEQPNEPETLGVTTLPVTGVPGNTDYSFIYVAASLIGGGLTLRYAVSKENPFSN